MLAVTLLRQKAHLALAVCLAAVVGLGTPTALAAVPRVAGAPAFAAATGAKEHAKSSHHVPRRVAAATPKRLVGDLPPADTASAAVPVLPASATATVAEPRPLAGADSIRVSARAPPVVQVLRS
jgi:hypothetical protein